MRKDDVVAINIDYVDGVFILGAEDWRGNVDVLAKEARWEKVRVNDDFIRMRDEQLLAVRISKKALAARTVQLS